MSSIFLSASVPIVGRGHYYETANPFLIQCAVRELVLAVIGSRRIVWGGHPAITPMIWAICEDLGKEYADAVVLYQSLYFQEVFPDENRHFGNVIFIEAVANDQKASLLKMREAMLSRPDLGAAVFIGGMDGVEVEHEMFVYYHPEAPVLTVAAPGGASLDLGKRISGLEQHNLDDVDFAKFFHQHLRLPSNNGMAGNAE